MLTLTVETLDRFCTAVSLVTFSTTSGAYKFALVFVLVVAKSLTVETAQRIWNVGLDGNVKPCDLNGWRRS